MLLNSGEAYSISATELTGRVLGGVNTYYQWFKNGVSISEVSSAPDYAIASYSDSDSGYYHCEITNTTLTAIVINTDSVYVANSSNTDLLSGLIAYYPFNNNANDESENTNHGTTIGASLTTDRHGNANSAYTFDGIDDYISVNNSESFETLTTNNKITISYWAYWNGDGFFPSINKLSDCDNGWHVQYTGTTLQFHLEEECGWKWVEGNWSPNANQWYLISATFDGATFDANIYVDGSSIFSGTLSSSVPNTSTHLLYIGANPAGGDEFCNGLLDDIRIYNRALSSQEIADIYTLESSNSTVPAAPSSLTANAVSPTQVNLSWTDNSDNEDGFYIYQSTDGTNFTQIDMLAANSTSYSNIGLSSLTAYFYYVCAYNNSGDACSNTASAITLESKTAPGAPSGLSANAVSSVQIDLTWTDNSDNEDGFYIYHSTDGSSFQQVDYVSSGITSYSHGGLNANSTYYYYVCAYNTIGENCSNTSSSTTFDGSAPQIQNQYCCLGESVPSLSAVGTDIIWYSDASLNTVAYYGSEFPTGHTQVGTYTYYATQTVESVESSASTATLNIYDLPYVDAGDDIQTCESSVVLQANTPSSGQGEWYIDAGNGYINSINYPSASYTDNNRNNAYLIWGITDMHGCYNADDINISFLEAIEEPYIHIKGGFIFICTTPNMYSYKWYKDETLLQGESKQYFVERGAHASTYGVEITNFEGCTSYSQVYHKSGLSKEQISINPMPVTELSSITIDNAARGKLIVRISDQTGTVYQSFEWQKTDELVIYQFNVSSLKQGFYVVEFIFENGERVFKKLVKQ